MKHRPAVVAAIALSLVGLVISGAFASARSRPSSGRGAVTPPTIEFSYYDDHVDAYVETDISDRAIAQAEGINFSLPMQEEKAKEYPPQYEFKGTAAAGQLTVFGSEPGEDTYTPFWDLAWVRWMPGVTPVLITSDTQVEKLEKHGKVSVKYTPILTNAPIIGVDVSLP